MDHLHETAFLDTAMGMSPLGTPESVSGLGIDGAKNFYGRGLAGPRVVVAGAGAVHQVFVLFLHFFFKPIKNKAVGSTVFASKLVSAEFV